MKYIYFLFYLFVTLGVYNQLSPMEENFDEPPSLVSLSLDALFEKIEKELKNGTKNVNDIIQLFKGHPEYQLPLELKEEVILMLIVYSDAFSPEQKTKIITELQKKEIFSSETQDILTFFHSIFSHHLRRDIPPLLAQAIKDYNLAAVRFLLFKYGSDPNKQIPARWQEHFFYKLYPLSYVITLLAKAYENLEEIKSSPAKTSIERANKAKIIKLHESNIEKLKGIIQELITAGANVWLEGEPLFWQPVYLALGIPISYSKDIKELITKLLQNNPEEINRIWQNQLGQEITLLDQIDSTINKLIREAEDPENAQKKRKWLKKIKKILKKFNAKKRAELPETSPWPIWQMIRHAQFERYLKWYSEFTAPE